MHIKAKKYTNRHKCSSIYQTLLFYIHEELGVNGRNFYLSFTSDSVIISLSVFVLTNEGFEAPRANLITEGEYF